ncbi:hypothetical protein Tco_0908486 [Tanacetum coccineum]|uniref:Retrovirus-related Pol polyprotein from transposon TNT 1-94-like beta-barrel domain-containing protein n=1 Tax=Tanacetum coccineum TaxID=301880 RepID=A0ABQ5CMC6_9ASTR
MTWLKDSSVMLHVSKRKRHLRLSLVRTNKGKDTLAIRVPLIDPTAKNENLMIEDIQWSRSKAQGECVRSLEAFLPAYKFKASSLTEGDLLLFPAFSSQSAIEATESLSEYELKKILYAKMHKSQSNLTHDMHQELFDALTWSMLLDKANMNKDVAPKIPKKDWFKDSPKLEVLDLDWNTVKTIDDAPEQPWFNEMVQAEKPSLTFDELMSTPIDIFYICYESSQIKQHHKRSSSRSSVKSTQSRSRVLGLNKWYQSLLRDFDLRSITFQTSQSQTEMDPYVTSTPNSIKLPILDTGKFKQWKFRIQQYLQHEHYALWEVIEFGDSYRAPIQDKSVSSEATPSSRSKGRTVAVTAEDMQKRRNDVKARTTLLLALPDEHQLRFSKYETTKELWEAILRTFGGNEATKKTKKNLLKQQYGNFKAEGSETLEQTFNRMQAIMSQLEFLDVPVEQKDLNQKFLTSLSPEWLMHTIVWRNRNDLDTMSLDDLYNHLKVYESEVQKKGGSSSQNMAFISSSNTNSGKSEVPTAQSFSTASGEVTTASTKVTTATFSHYTICAYIATQQSGSQIKYKDITHIDDDDIEEMDIKWKMALLSMRADRAPRSQDRSRRERYKKEPKVEEPSHKAMMAIDGIRWDWSFMAEKMKLQRIKHLGLSQVKARLVEFKINESKFCKKIRVLERDLELKDYKIENLTNELEEVKKERYDIDSKLEKFVNSSKDLDQMLESQKLGKDKKGVGFDEYRAVPPPPAQVYSSPMLDLSWTCLPEFADNTVTNYTRPTPSVDVTNDVRSELDGNNLTVCEHRGTSSNVVSKPIINFVKESGCPNVIKINNIENARKPTAKYAELYRNITQSSNVRSNNFGPPIIEDWDSEDESDTESTPIESIRSTINQNRDQPRGNQRNWNNLKSQQLGKDFVMQNKACYKCGSFEHLKVNCNKNKWVNKGKNWSRVNYTQGNLTPKAILLKSGTKTIAPNRSFSTARTSLNVAQPKMKSFVKSAHSNVKRPFERKAVAKNKIWVPTVRTKNPTVGLKVPTAKPTVAAAKGNKGKAVKASARWIWKPKQISGEGSNVNGVSGKPLDNIDDKGFWDSGCSRHMTGNISYLSDYEPYDGGYVSFGYGGGKITGKGTIKTGKLEFENVHFVKELKYNLFSVSQICDNKNCVLFTDSECIVLGRDFKLEDDRHVLLRTPRQKNMYDVDLKDIVPHKNLTCLIAKASVNESMLWHRRLHDNVADLLTKAFDVGRFQYLVSTARIETADGETSILAKINGKQRTISESSIRRHLKLNDEEGISTLLDNELFENLSLMGYNILPNQRFSFQKGQFSCQWKFLIHTIMQCLSPKSTSFNKFSSNIATALVCLATNRSYNFSKMIFDGMMRNVKSKGKFLMYPRFIEKLLKMSQFGTIKHSEIYPVPFQTQKVFTTLRVNSPSFSGKTVPLFDTMIVQQGEGSENQLEPHHTPSTQHVSPPHPTHTSSPHEIQSTPPEAQTTPQASLPHTTNIPSHTPTPSLDAGQDRENIPKTSAIPHESFPRVTSLGGDEGSLKQTLKEFMEFCTTLQSHQTQMADKIQSDAEKDSSRSTDKRSESTGDLANVLSSMGAANILASGDKIPDSSSSYHCWRDTTPYSKKDQEHQRGSPTDLL